VSAEAAHDSLRRREHCPACHAPATGEIAIRRGDGLGLRRCPDCAALFVDPAPGERTISSFYGRGYFSGECDFFRGSDYCELRDRSIANGTVTGFAEVAANFQLAGKAVLDVGCASGALLASLRALGPARLVGIDVSEYPLEFGRTRYGLDLRCARLETAGFAAGSFDLITMVDVVEHLDDLPAFLEAARYCLAQDGAIYVSTPNADAFAIAGDEWIALNRDYEHLLYIGVESAARIARRHGLVVSKSWTSGYPVALASYQRPSAARLRRFICEPAIALANARRKWRYRHAPRRGCGEQLHMILRTESFAAATRAIATIS
jgi:SAM-dependent methyltransferase